MSKRVRLLLALPAFAALSVMPACEQRFRDMYDQPRYKPLAPSDLWGDGRASRPPVDGTLPQSRGTFAGASSGRAQQSEPEPPVLALEALRDDVREAAKPGASPSFALPPITPQLLARGHDRFDIFCAPCHSVAGDGDGMVARRGFPHPPSFHSDRLRSASDAHFYAVITYGYGAMYSYATRVEPADRVAIVAYIRALQLSQHALAARLADEDRAHLPSASGATR